MIDTEANNARIEAYKKMSYQQKWDEFLKLHKLAWDLKYAGIKSQYPHLSEKQIVEKVRKIFLYATT